MTTVAPKVNGRRPRAVPLPDQEGPGSLAEALLAFQAEAPKLRATSPGQVGSRTYMYASLDSVLDDVVPLLLTHQLLWTAKPTTDEHGNPAALYRMTHVPSGEFDEWTGPLPCVDPGPQALGSAITYMRRYTLVAYLNLAPGEDDDGAAAAAAGYTTRTPPVYEDRNDATPSTPPAAATSPQPTAAPAKGSERPASVQQRKMLRARAGTARLTPVAFANVILVAKGEPPHESTDQEAATRWLKREIDRLPARLVNAVLEGIETS